MFQNHPVSFIQAHASDWLVLFQRAPQARLASSGDAKKKDEDKKVSEQERPKKDLMNRTLAMPGFDPGTSGL